MLVKMTSKHQVTIPQKISSDFHLGKGDFLEVLRDGNKIIMIPKEVVFEDKYPVEDLEAAEHILSKNLGKEEVKFNSVDAMLKFLKQRVKK